MRAITVTKERGSINIRAALDAITVWFQTCANGDYIITMKKVQKKRSDPQNRLMWVWFGIIAQAWSDAAGRVFTPEDVHDAYCLLFLPKETPKGRVAGSTSGLTQDQMSEFLDRVQADAETEYGIQLPSPEDKFFEAIAEEYSNHS